MSKLEILVGNIGSGKSLIAKKLANKGSFVVSMDAIQQMASGGEYGSYDYKRKDIYQRIEEEGIEQSLRHGISVCVDRTNMDAKRRKRFIDIGKKHTDNIVCYDFGKGNQGGLERRYRDNRIVPYDTWHDVYCFMEKSYEKPSLSEGFNEILYLPEKYEFHAFDFDGTIVTNKFPDIGQVLDGTVAKMNDLYQDLKNIIIIWTCRDGDYLSSMKEFLLKSKIPFDFINENPMYPTGSNKIFAHKYYDDRNSEF